jgi:hypothetical protein
MILFILLAIGFALYTIFADSGLIDSIKDIEETNKEVKDNIEYGRINYDAFSFREYNEHDYEIDYIKANIKYLIFALM